MTGKLPPTKVNPVPDTVAAFTVTGEVPVEVKLKVFCAEVLTDTLPKPKVAEFTVNCGLPDIPVPLTTRLIAPLVASLLILNWPVDAPVASGLN